MSSPIFQEPESYQRRVTIHSWADCGTWTRKPRLCGEILSVTRETDIRTEIDWITGI